MVMQQLEVSITVPIPSDSVIVKKVELETLKKQSLSGVYWTMKDLEKRTNKSSKWLKDNLLYVQKFKKILDSENGGCVYYPKSQGQTWSFQAVRMAEFLDSNFGRIFG